MTKSVMGLSSGSPILNWIFLSFFRSFCCLIISCLGSARFFFFGGSALKEFKHNFNHRLIFSSFFSPSSHPLPSPPPPSNSSSSSSYSYPHFFFKNFLFSSSFFFSSSSFSFSFSFFFFFFFFSSGCSSSTVHHLVYRTDGLVWCSVHVYNAENNF